MTEEATEFKYRAFIAFNKSDAPWAEDLQRALESVRIPAQFVGSETPYGPAPENLRPIFGYGDALPEGQGEFTDEAAAALATSLFLVVLCSPDSAKSEHLDAAVRRFKSAGKRDRIIPVIIGGEPRSDEHECFPAALRFKLADDGALSVQPDDPVAPLVIDARPEGDGKDRAVQKLTAALAGLDPGAYLQAKEAIRAAEPGPRLTPLPMIEPHAVTERTQAIEVAAAEPGQAAMAEQFHATEAPSSVQPAPSAAGEQPAAVQKPAPAAKPARKPRSRMGARLFAAAVLLLILVGALVWLRYELPRKPPLLDAVLDKGTTMTTRMVDVAEHFSTLRFLTGGLAKTNAAALRNVAEWAPDTPALRYRKAAMLIAFARQDAALGHASAARENITEANALLAGIGSERLDNPTLESKVAMAQLAVGSALLANGAADEALKTLRPSLATLQRRAAADPDNAERQRDLSLAENAVGDALLAKGQIEEALQRYQQALAIRQRLVKRDSQNDAWRRDLSVSQERIGDVLLAKTELNDALKAYQTSLALRLAAVDLEASGDWQRQLAVSYNKIGDVLVARGALDEALNDYRAGLALQLAAANRDSAARRDLSVTYERIGDVLRAQHAWDEALAAYRESLAIRLGLAVDDPGNARWERDLPVSHERIGDILMARGATGDAVAAYRTSLATRERLARNDAKNLAMQRDLAVSYNKLGDALTAQGAKEEALKAYRAGLAIRQRLLALDPSDAQSQWDLLVLQWRLASGGDDPVKRFELIVATLRDLAAKHQLSAEQARWLPAAEQELARVQRQ
ncbi:MAG: tetratricopeptide repeat protein [Xanthobacteraceae bacterium]